uniref:Tubulin tyrosine ligase-like family, member 2 n=1 Tax=Mastacembelus armatus TaxID=205130 RepID=A0A7N8XUU6_9TELE
LSVVDDALWLGPSVYWICKPVDLSRGRGIFIFEDIKDLVYDCSVIVQRYISSPLLISGYKFDLRIYVCVKSFHPLTVYIHQEGLVRFATEKYSLSSLKNLYAHLTNTSINKFGPFYKTQKERVGQGCKWTLSKFRHFLHSQDINQLLLWQRINNIVTLTLLTIAPSVPSCPNCVELFAIVGEESLWLSSRDTIGRWEKVPQSQLSLQPSTSRGFMVEWPDGSLSSVQDT